jgi:flagellar FliJ protein
MTWRQSLIRIARHEVDTLQRRLAEIVERRGQAEIRLALLQAEAEAEAQGADHSAETSRNLAEFMGGVRLRRGVLQAAIAAIAAEESGARDALAQAFESKKFEQVAEMARVADEKESARRDTLVLDEVGMRAARR